MRIFICCSKAFYGKVPEVQSRLEAAGHTITLPNSFDNPRREDEMRDLGVKQHSEWKAEMLRRQEQKIKANDAILVINLDKNGHRNYVGGATFLEMFKAFELGKKIFLYNDVPEGMLRDEIHAFEPILINRDLSLVV
jgi:hypothetical protein